MLITISFFFSCVNISWIKGDLEYLFLLKQIRGATIHCIHEVLTNIRLHIIPQHEHNKLMIHIENINKKILNDIVRYSSCHNENIHIPIP